MTNFENYIEGNGQQFSGPHHQEVVDYSEEKPEYMEDQPPLELLDIDDSFIDMDAIDGSQIMETYPEFNFPNLNFGETAQDKISDGMGADSREEKTNSEVSGDRTDYPDALNDENFENRENPEDENPHGSFGREKRVFGSTSVGHGKSSEDQHAAGAGRVCFLHMLFI